MSDANSIRPERRYTKDHEWALVDESQVKVGITPFAVDQLGEITLVTFDVAPGDTVEAGATLGTIESVKTVSDLFAPISGRIESLNAQLEEKPELVNEDCWDAGWMAVIVPGDPQASTASLLTADAYSDHLDSSDH